MGLENSLRCLTESALNRWDWKNECSLPPYPWIMAILQEASWQFSLNLPFTVEVVVLLEACALNIRSSALKHAGWWFRLLSWSEKIAFALSVPMFSPVWNLCSGSAQEAERSCPSAAFAGLSSHAKQLWPHICSHQLNEESCFCTVIIRLNHP